MKPLKIGVIGTGGIARDRHIPLIQQHERAELIGVYDVNEALAREVATQFEIAYVAPTLEALLAQVEAVIICTPNKFHADLTIVALDAGVHVLCEKPMAMTTAECDAMMAVRTTQCAYINDCISLPFYGCGTSDKTSRRAGCGRCAGSLPCASVTSSKSAWMGRVYE